MESRGLSASMGQGNKSRHFSSQLSCQLLSTASQDTGLGRCLLLNLYSHKASENAISPWCDRPSMQTTQTAHSLVLRAGRPALGTLGPDYLVFKFCDTAICTYTNKRHIFLFLAPQIWFSSLQCSLRCICKSMSGHRVLAQDYSSLTNGRYSLKEHRRAGLPHLPLASSRNKSRLCRLKDHPQ